MKRKNYLKALSYFKEAELIKNYRNHLNLSTLYDDMIEAYKILGQNKNINKYKAKRDSLKLNISESQNKSLHNILENKEEEKKSPFLYPILFFIIIVIATLLLFIFRKKHKNSSVELSIQNEVQTEMNPEEISKLLEMFKKNDLAFISYFNNVFPDFSKKLLEINPNIIQSEIEFCSLLKLNIPTKDIVRYRNLAHRTVQNKKYLIRKKLDIPKEKDIYQWFSNV